LSIPPTTFRSNRVDFLEGKDTYMYTRYKTVYLYHLFSLLAVSLTVKSPQVLMSGSITCLLFDHLIVLHCLVLIVWDLAMEARSLIECVYGYVRGSRPKSAKQSAGQSAGRSSCTCLSPTCKYRMEGNETSAIMTHRIDCLQFPH